MHAPDPFTWRRETPKRQTLNVQMKSLTVHDELKTMTAYKRKPVYHNSGDEMAIRRMYSVPLEGNAPTAQRIASHPKRSQTITLPLLPSAPIEETNFECWPTNATEFSVVPREGGGEDHLVRDCRLPAARPKRATFHSSTRTRKVNLGAPSMSSGAPDKPRPS